MEMTNVLCGNLAKILGGKSSFRDGVCAVAVDRPEIRVTVAGRRGPVGIRGAHGAHPQRPRAYSIM